MSIHSRWMERLEDLLVQGRSVDQRQLGDVEALAGHLLAPGGMFAFLAGHRRELFPDELFADLFGSARGRPSVPADVVATVIVLQALHGLSDREAAEAVTFDLRWKAACGLPVSVGAFHATTLTYWRRRLAASDRPNRIFETVKAVVAQTAVLTGKTRRALDSTVLDDAVATQDTVTQVIAAIRRVRRDVPGAAAVIAEVCSAHDYDDPGKPAIAWEDEQARAALVDALVADAHRLLGSLPETERDARQAEALALLALVAGQDVEWIEDPTTPIGGSWRIARGVAEDRIVSVHDEEARHAHKTLARGQDGVKAHVAVEPDTGIVTDCQLSKASGAGSSDAAVGLTLWHRSTNPSRCWPTPPTAAATCSPASPTPSTLPRSSPGRSGRQCPAGSPSTTSTSMSRPAPSPALTLSPGQSPATVTRSLAGRVPAAHCGLGAPPHNRAARCGCTSTMRCAASTASGPPPPTSKPCTGSTGRWWNAPLPGWSPAATAGCATAASSATTPGCTPASPRSTCADCSCSACTTGTAPGPSPDRSALARLNDAQSGHPLENGELDVQPARGRKPPQ